jgi:hypothetical protein
MGPDALQPSFYDAVPPIQTVRLQEMLRLSPLSAIEMFHPKLARQLCLMWGSPEMNTFLSQIAMADGQASKIQLNGAELSEIASLAAIHADLLPPTRGVWHQPIRL